MNPAEAFGTQKSSQMEAVRQDNADEESANPVRERRPAGRTIEQTRNTSAECLRVSAMSVLVCKGQNAAGVGSCWIDKRW